MKFNLNSIFSKNTKQNHQNQSYQNIPAFTIRENGPTKNDYEVAEMSYEEYSTFVCHERRKSVRGSGEIRSAYNAQLNN